MVVHGFFTTQSDLKTLAEPISSLLNGSNDTYSNDKFVRGDITKARYF